MVEFREPAPVWRTEPSLFGRDATKGLEFAGKAKKHCHFEDTSEDRRASRRGPMRPVDIESVQWLSTRVLDSAAMRVCRPVRFARRLVADSNVRTDVSHRAGSRAIRIRLTQFNLQRIENRPLFADGNLPFNA